MVNVDDVVAQWNDAVLYAVANYRDKPMSAIATLEGAGDGLRVQLRKLETHINGVSAQPVLPVYCPGPEAV